MCTFHGIGDRPHACDVLYSIHVQIYPLTSPFSNSLLVIQPNHTQYPPETLPLLQIMVGNVQGIFDVFGGVKVLLELQDDNTCHEEVGIPNCSVHPRLPAKERLRG